jgi:hypothetical protein
MAYGFRFAYRESGGCPTIQEFVFTGSETLTKGDLVSIESGKASLGASDDATLAGVAVETVVGTADVSKIKVVTDRDAVYAIDDATARVAGTVLDFTGTTGAMALDTDAHHDVIVVAASSATEPTLVKIIEGAHFLSLQKT